MVEPDGATPWHLGAWLATFAGVWVTVAWLAPRVTKIFEKSRLRLPVPTEAVLWLQHFSHSWVGILVAIAIVAASVYGFVKLRERRWVRVIFVALTWLGLASLPFVGMGVFLPLVNMARV